MELTKLGFFCHLLYICIKKKKGEGERKSELLGRSREEAGRGGFVWVAGYFLRFISTLITSFLFWNKCSMKPICNPIRQHSSGYLFKTLSI